MGGLCQSIGEWKNIWYKDIRVIYEWIDEGWRDDLLLMIK